MEMEMEKTKRKGWERPKKTKLHEQEKQNIPLTSLPKSKRQRVKAKANHPPMHSK